MSVVCIGVTAAVCLGIGCQVRVDVQVPLLDEVVGKVLPMRPHLYAPASTSCAPSSATCRGAWPASRGERGINMGKGRRSDWPDVPRLSVMG